MQVGPMNGVVRCAESSFDRFSQRRTEQKAAIVPTSLVECYWFDAGASKPFGNPQPMQEARSVGANLDAGTDLAKRACLLVDLHIEPRPEQYPRCGETADSAADTRDRGPTRDDHT